MIDRSLDWCVSHRKSLLCVLAVITAVMGFFASKVEIKTVFADLLPQNHQFVQINNQFKQAYGGSNMVSVMVEVEQGDIFTLPVLEKIKAITDEASKTPGADPFQVTSIASKKLKEITSSTDGIKTKPLMWPELPRSADEIAQLKKSVTNNPLVYGAYVSRDYKAALITVDFYDHLVDYRKIFEHLTKIVDQYEQAGLHVRVVGDPMLYGWVIHYFGETAKLFVGAVIALLAVLFLIARTWHGTVIPVAAAAMSAVWAVGFSGALGYHLDPLVVVVAFLITALAISNSIQIVQRFDHRLTHGAESTPEGAAKSSLKKLFRPAMLAVVADAGCMIIVALTPIPLLQKIAIIGGFWVLSLAICAVILPALLASTAHRPTRWVHPINLKPAMHAMLGVCAHLATSRWRYVVIGVSAVVFVASGVYAFKLKVGDANPGSPILEADSTYNRDAAAINSAFQGSDRMFVVLSSDKSDAIKDPEVLRNMESFQRYMEAQPEIGGTVSIVDVLPAVNRVLHEGNPRFLEPGPDAAVNGELAYLFVSGSDPGDMQRFASNDFSNASVTLYFRDHQGDTIRNAVARVKEFVASHPSEKGEYLLAGGLVGVLAAVNDVILAGQIEAIALALLFLALLCAATYRSLAAGTFFMIPVVLSNTLTFSYMAYHGIGMNINTLPVVALGIGLGVDYSFYVVDAIREEMRLHGRLDQAIVHSLNSAGMGVLTTVLTLVAGVSLWALSSLRLQSEMAALIAIWLSISALASLILMPALVYVFKPAFVVGSQFKGEAESSMQPQAA